MPFSKTVYFTGILGLAMFLVMGSNAFGSDLNRVISPVKSSNFISAAKEENPLPELIGSSNAEQSMIPAGSLPEPDNTAVCEGSNATFKVTVLGTYQWESSTNSGGIWTPIVGETNNTLTLASVSYSMNGNQYRCIIDGTASNAAILTVNPHPGAAAALTVVTTPVCIGSSGKSYVVPAIDHADSYVWTFPFGATIVSGSGTRSVGVNYSNAAVSGTITVLGRNACGDGVPATSFVAVNPYPLTAGSISGTPTVCQGQSAVDYTVAPILNATGYTWSLPTGATITAGANTNTITVNFSATAISGNITVTGTNTCGNGGVSPIYPLTVNPLPGAASAIVGTGEICKGATGVNYSVNAISNASGYVWSLPVGSVITAGTNTKSITVDFPASVVSGNITVTGTNACGTGITSVPFVLTVQNSMPSKPGTISGPTNPCQGATGVVYSIAALSNASSYSWTVPIGATIVSGGTTNSITVNYASNAVNGNVTVFGINACGNGAISDPLAVSVTLLPSAAGAISGTSNVCQGQTGVNYSVPAIVGATSYVWTVPSGVTIVSGQGTSNLTVNFSNSVSAGSISVAGHNVCGDGTSSSMAFTVNSLPSNSGSITGSATVCQGYTSVSYMVSVIPNAISYTWTVPPGATITSASPQTNTITVDFSASASSGNISVKGTNACGDGFPSPNYAVTVQAIPSSAGAITGTAGVCQGQSGIVYNVPAITGATGYTWNLPAGASITAGINTNSVTVKYSALAVSGVVSVYGINSCGSGPVSADFPVTVSSLPAAAGALISGLPIVCQGSAGVGYSIAPVSNATGYNWSLPPGASIVSGSNTNAITVNYALTASSGNVSVYATNSCGNGATSAAYPVTVNPLPLAAAAISGTSTICQGATGLTYTVPAISYATGYNWTLPAGASIVAGNNTNTIQVDFSSSASSGILTVSGTNSCGTGKTSPNYNITLSPLPSAAGTITGLTSVCPGQNAVTYSVPTIPNATSYSWTVPSGATIVSGGTTNSIIVNYSITAVSGALTVTGVNNCGSGTVSANYPVVVNSLPVAAGVVTGSAKVCQGEVGVVYNVPAITNATGYTWVLPAGASISSGANTNSITVTYAANAASGNISVYGFNSCGNGTASANLAVAVDPLPSAASNITGPTTACQNDAGVTYSVPAINNATSYFWTLPVGATIAGGAGTNIITVNFSAGALSGIVSVHGVNSCGNGVASALPVTVGPVPTMTSTLAPAPICSNTPFSYVPAGTPVGAIFKWSRAATIGISNPATSGTGNPNETLVNTTSSPVSVTYVYTVTANGCTSPSVYNVSILVNPVPLMNSSVTPIIQCNDIIFNYVPTSLTPATTFSWTRSAVSGISNPASSGSPNIGETLNNTGIAPIKVTYVYTLDAGGCKSTQNMEVTINPTPKLSTSLSPPAVCSNTTFNYLPGSFTIGTTSNWSRATVPGISNLAATGTGNPAEILMNTTTLPVVVTYVYSLTANGCTNPINYDVNVTVNPSALLTSSLTPADICSGAMFSYSPSSTIPGATITWSRGITAGISNGPSSGAGNVNEILNNTTVSPVKVNYIFTLTFGSCVMTQTVPVTVNPLPVLNSSLTPASICDNAVFNYTPSSLVAGASFSWSRAAVAGISNLASSGFGNPSETLENTTNLTISVPYVFTTNANGCSNNQNVVVVVNPLPVLTSILAPPAICSGTGFNYMPTSSTPGAVFNWTRAAVAGISNLPASGTGNPGETLTNTSAVPLTVTYVYTVSINGCANPVKYSVDVVVNPSPALSTPLIAPPICSGSVFSYTPGSGTAGTVFNWNRSNIPGIVNPAASGSGNPSEPLVNTTNTPLTVNYAYILSANGCNNTQNVQVIVNPYPVLTSSLNPANICSNSLFNYTPVSSTSGTTFNWSRSFIAGISNATATGTGSPNELLINTTSLPIAVTYTYSLTANGCTNPTTYNVSVNVNPLPTLSSTLTPNPICSNTPFVYTPTSANGVISGWTRAAVAGISNPAGSGVLNPNETLVNTTASPVNVTYVYTLTLGSCSNTQNVVVTVNPNPVLSGTLTPSAICSGSLFSYNPASNSAGATFSWSRVSVAGISNPSSSGTVNPNEILMNTTPAAIPVTYVYQISANGCNSTQNVVVQVNPLPVLTSALLPPAICSNSTFSYTPASSTPGTTFTWSRAAVIGIANPSSSGVGNPNETLLNLTAAPVNVTYAYTCSANGCTNPTTFNVVVSVNPSASLTSSLTPTAICSGSIFNYVATSSSAGAVLTWSRSSLSGIVQPAATGSGDINEILTNSTASPVVVTYQYTLFMNGCTKTQNVSVTVNPSPELTSSLSPPAICSGTTLHYGATSSTPGVTFNWTRLSAAGIVQPPTSGTGNVNETLTNNSAVPVNVTYEYTLSANGCTSNKFNVVVAVNSVPVTPAVTITGPTTFCTGDHVVLTAPAGYNYQWSNGASTQAIEVTTSGSFSVVVKDAIGCPSSPSAPAIATTALPAPAPPISGGDITQCLDAPIAQVIVPKATAPAGCTVKWYDAPSGGNLIAAPSYSGLGIKSFFAESYNTLTGCTSLIRTQVTINVISHPAAPIKDADIVECEKNPLQTLIATATVPVGVTVKWYAAATGGLPVTPTLHAVSTVSYYAEADNGTCTSLARTKVTLTINPSPLPPVSLGNITECERSPIQTLTALSSNPTAIWYNTATGGSPVGSPTLSVVGSITYFAESVLGTCPSLTRSTGVVLTINSTPEAPIGVDPIIQCEQNPIQTLTAVATPPTGSTVKWYTVATGGVPVASPTINSVTSRTYYAESDNGTCKSLTRTAVALQIKAAPKVPVAGKSITECANLPNVQTLTATATTTTGSTISWYETAIGGDPVTPSLSQIGTTTYYAEANNGNCNSTARSSGVVLTINPTPASPVTISVTECAAKPLQVLTAQAVTPADGATITWYNTLTGGTVVTSPTLKAIGTKTYYAESKLDKCINPTRTPIVLTINSAASDPVLKVKGRDSIVVCQSTPIDTLDARDLFTVVPNVSLVCFDAATGGFEVSPLVNYVGTKILYVAAKTIGSDCLSYNRIPVRLTIHGAPPAPVSSGDIFACALRPLQTLDATKSVSPDPGTKIVWYDKATGGNVVLKPTLNKADTTVVYFAESVDLVSKCTSLTRTSVKLSIGSTKASAASNSPLALGQTLLLKGGPEAVGNSYLWTDPHGFTFSSMDVVIPNVPESAAGMYHLTVSSANGCTAIDSIRVILDIANAEAQTPICIGSTLYLSGYPNGMKSYAWTGPAGFTSSQQNPSIDHVTMSNAGTYTLIVMNSNNATSSDTVSVSFRPLPIPVAEVTTLCPAGTMQLKAGPNGMTSYLWSFPSGSTSTLQSPLPMAFPNPPADFKLTVVDWNGCEASKVITPVKFQPTATSNSPLCTGDTLRLRGEPNGMAVYRWSGPNNFLSNLQSPSINNVNAATATGDYTLTVIDPAGCTFSTKVNVTFNTPPPVPTIYPNINPICEGSTLILNGGPSGMAGYDWTGPDGFISKDQNPQITLVKEVNAGKYSLDITTPQGCKSSFSTNVSVVSVKFNGTYGPYCISDSPVSLSVSPVGGTFSGPGVTGNIFDPKAAGEGTHTIQYTYSGSGGLCTVVAYKYIDVVTIPALVTNTAVLPSCTGSTADLTLPAVTLGSTPGLILSYWTDSKATLGLPSPKAVAAGMYYIKGATVSGKCFDIKPVKVMQPDSLRAVMKVKPTDCYGDASGTMEVSVTLGTAPFTYLWSTNPPQSAAKAINLNSGVYSVVITDAKMCSVTLTDTVKEANTVKMYFSKNDVDCLSDANGSAKVDSVLSSGTKADINLFTYLWNSNPVQTTRQAVKLTYGYYIITLTNEKGCAIRDSVLIDVRDSIPPTIVCPKDIDMIVHATKSTDGSPNTIVVDLGKPIAKDNCTVVNVVNDAPDKFRYGQTIVTWTVTDQAGMVDTCQQVVNIKEFPTIPQLISPNGDGINDTFVIEGIKSFPGSQLLIFTRSGQLVYQSNDYQDDWDGRYGASTFSHNKLVAPGVYYYVLTLGGGLKQKVQGYVYIYY